MNYPVHLCLENGLKSSVSGFGQGKAFSYLYSGYPAKAGHPAAFKPSPKQKPPLL